MEVINITKKTVVTSDLKMAKSTIDRLLGLLKTSNPRSLMFETRFGIHTFFLKETIDVVILDKFYIVKKVSTLEPNRFFFYNFSYPFILELPKNTIKKAKITIGDKLKVQ